MAEIDDTKSEKMLVLLKMSEARVTWGCSRAAVEVTAGAHSI